MLQSSTPLINVRGLTNHLPEILCLSRDPKEVSKPYSGGKSCRVRRQRLGRGVSLRGVLATCLHLAVEWCQLVVFQCLEHVHCGLRKYMDEMRAACRGDVPALTATWQRASRT